MYHTTGFAKDEIIDLCALVYANEENCDIDPWPPSLGLYKSVVIALTYMRRNRVQQELAETYETSQPTISRANARITSRLAIVLAPFVPTAEDRKPSQILWRWLRSLAWPTAATRRAECVICR